MDEKLICLLNEKSEVWNKKMPDFRSKQKKTEAWKYIGEQLNITGALAERRYKNLRERYRREKARLNIAARKSGEIPVEKWNLFERLRFLDDVQTPRRTFSNIIAAQIQKPKLEDIEVSDLSDPDLTSDNPCFEQKLVCNTPDSDEQIDQKKTKLDDIGGQIVASSVSNLDILVDSMPKDDVSSFLLFIGDEIRKLNEPQRDEIKEKTIKLIYDIKRRHF